MRRVTGCLVVLSAIAAAWIGCRDDFGVEDHELGLAPGTGTGTGTGTDGIDAAIDAPDPGSGSVDAGVDAAIDAPVDSPVDAPDGSMQGPGDAAVGGDARGTNDLGPLDRTSFYACAGGGCRSSTGAEVWLPLAIALGFALRRPRARRRSA